MKTAIYTIRCLTNMHVGKGGATYEVVDNCVQRDVTTGFPCIYSSSLKGALRQYFKSKNFASIDYVFGSEGKNENQDNSVGNFTFFQANLFAYPVRSSDMGEKPYTLRTSKALTSTIANLANEFDLKFVLEESEFCDDYSICTELEQLPVIARNKLDNGESKNLWYEEVIPSETRFVFFVSYDNEEIFKAFDQILQEGLVQIGANGSIGYGFCKIKNVTKNQK